MSSNKKTGKRKKAASKPVSKRKTAAKATAKTKAKAKVAPKSKRPSSKSTRARTASKPVSKRKTVTKSTAKTKTKAKRATKPKESMIVRIMGQGQYVVGRSTVQELNKIDNSIVKLIESKEYGSEGEDDGSTSDFRKQLTRLVNLAIEKGTPLDAKEIVESDIMLPNADISIDEAKELFSGDGVVQEIF